VTAVGVGDFVLLANSVCCLPCNGRNLRIVCRYRYIERTSPWRYGHEGSESTVLGVVLVHSKMGRGG